ncbi:hypothetical protein HKD37_18G051241 [Glycine soja]
MKENLKSQRLLTVGRKRSYLRLSARDRGSLNQTSRGNGPLQLIRTVWTTLPAIQKQNTAPHVLSRGGYEYLKQKLLAEKTKKKLKEAAQSGSVDGVIDSPSPVRRHMAGTKKTGEMTTEAAMGITEKIIPLRSRHHRDPSSPMDVRMFSPLLLDVQSTLDVSGLLEPVSPSGNTSDRLHGRPAALPCYLLKNCNS